MRFGRVVPRRVKLVASVSRPHVLPVVGSLAYADPIRMRTAGRNLPSPADTALPACERGEQTATTTAIVENMRITVLGGSGAWPTPDAACSGFLVEHDGFRLLMYAGYAVVPRLLAVVPGARIDAVVISHGHPDHCADLNPLLRVRALSGDPAPALPVYALPGALDAVLALDRAGMLDDAIALREFAGGDRFGVGPFTIDTRLLPHFVPNAGMRVAADGVALAYTGDCGPDPAVVELAQEVDLLIAEATYADDMPSQNVGYLTTARQAAGQAARAGVGRLLLTHLRPDTDPAAARDAASDFDGDVEIASPDLSIDLPLSGRWSTD